MGIARTLLADTDLATFDEALADTAHVTARALARAMRDLATEKSDSQLALGDQAIGRHRRGDCTCGV